MHWPGIEFDALCQPALANLDTSRIFAMAEPLIESNQAFGDVPFCLLYREFLERFPDARYFVVLRNVNSWVSSVRRHTSNRELHNLEKMQYWLNGPLRKHFIQDYDDADLTGIYIRHVKSVVNTMHSSGAKFRIFELEETSLAQATLSKDLATFLGFEARHPFPTVNVYEPRFARGLNAAGD
jgi:hypothetical protein